MGVCFGMKQKQLWINQIKGMCICLVVIYHSVITFYPNLTGLDNHLAVLVSKAWVYFNLYLAPFRMPVFFFISGYLIRRYISEVPWKQCLDKRVLSILYVLVLWGAVQWLGLRQLNEWLAPERDISDISNAAYAESLGEFLYGMITASTSLWYLYALIVYFVIFKAFYRFRVALFVVLVGLSIIINFLPTPWWGLNSVIRNMPYYSLGAFFGGPLIDSIKAWRPRRLPIFALLVVASVPFYFLNVPLFISLLSIVAIMKLFYLYEQWRGANENSLFNVIGSNTIAVYTTHRILIEAMSLVLVAKINRDAFSDTLLLALLLVYPFISLALCTLVGLGVRKFSTLFVNDALFSPPKPLMVNSDAR